eukprot:s2350_g9.t1
MRRLWRHRTRMGSRSGGGAGRCWKRLLLRERSCHSAGHTLQSRPDGNGPGCEYAAKSCSPWTDVCEMAYDFPKDFVRFADLRARHGQFEFELLPGWQFI